MKNTKLLGIFMMLIASLCFSLGGFLIKYIPWNAFAINGARNFCSCIVIGIYICLTHHKIKWNTSVLIGAVCMAGVTSLFTLANKMTTAGNAIILQYTAPVWIIVLMFLFFRKAPSRLEVCTIFAVLVGIVCFFLDSLSSGNFAGDLLAIISGIFYAGLFILNEFKDGDSLSSIFMGQLINAVTQTPFVRGETDFSFRVIVAVLVLGVVQVGLAYVCFSIGTRLTDPVTAAVIAAMEPILNPVLVAVFYGELLTPISLAGAGIVLVAVLFYNIAKGAFSL